MEVGRVVREISFEKALADTAGQRRHILLANGFSRNYDNDRFAYQSLRERAATLSAPIERHFSELGTPDFEAVLNAISDLQRDAQSESELRELRRQEVEVKLAFLSAVEEVHPASAIALSNEEVETCAKFLHHFCDPGRPETDRGKIFTTNYDLLLFWVIARQSKMLKCYDGFTPEPFNDAYRPWDPDPDRSPGLVYLHGALHIYRRGRDHRMLRYRAGARLVDQIRDRFKVRDFPLIVAEGKSEQKAARIDKSDYLKHALGIFRGALANDSVLFTFGHSLDARDRHILQLVGSRQVRAVYIGAYGGLNSDDGARAKLWAEKWWVQRDRASTLRPLRVYVFDSSTCRVWR